MTVDMLAATFFWPEGTLFGAPPVHPDSVDPDELAIEHPDGSDQAAASDGFWSTVLRSLWRPSSATPAPTT